MLQRLSECHSDIRFPSVWNKWLPIALFVREMLVVAGTREALAQCAKNDQDVNLATSLFEALLFVDLSQIPFIHQNMF